MLHTRINPVQTKEIPMKTKWAVLVVTTLLCTAPFVFGQDASADKKSTGTEMKDAAKTATKDTEKGAKTAAKDTEKAADKTGSAVKKGVKGVGHDLKKGTEKTADTLK